MASFIVPAVLRELDLRLLSEHVLIDILEWLVSIPGHVPLECVRVDGPNLLPLADLLERFGPTIRELSLTTSSDEGRDLPTLAHCTNLEKLTLRMSSTNGSTPEALVDILMALVGVLASITSTRLQFIDFEFLPAILPRLSGIDYTGKNRALTPVFVKLAGLADEILARDIYESLPQFDAEAPRGARIAIRHQHAEEHNLAFRRLACLLARVFEPWIERDVLSMTLHRKYFRGYAEEEETLYLS
ncbi:hypothetical protein EVJ58_g10201 [Rhodofomes roseus]|uniref:Uncharacterized protein n=1 Tax=Rhodofomes roseus TaxID=34475 RepID=A0A4Y9XU70_9APHY|nr:hypothetical protein EVJ58_g10201 [Rhodofomes roseus]